MSADACAALVERGDPERFRAGMAAAAGPARDGLMALYAFNLEIARAGYVASEPMLGAIRLRWWAEAVDEIFDGAAPRAHEVCGPLAEAIRRSRLPQAPFEALIAAREWDCGRHGFADLGALEAYLEATAAGLTWLAALHLRAPAGAEPVVRDAGRAAGAAGFLRGLPKFEALGRRPLPDGAAGARALAAAGLGWLKRARARRGAVPRRALPALLPVATAGAVLRQAAARPEAALAGGLEPSQFAVRARMLAAALTGQW